MENIIISIIQTQIEMSQSIQTIKSQVFIQFQEFLQRRYEAERRSIILDTKHLDKAQEWNYEEMEGWKAGEEDITDAKEAEEWTMGYNQLIEIKEELEDEDVKLEERWIENEKRKPQMIC